MVNAFVSSNQFAYFYIAIFSCMKLLVFKLVEWFCFSSLDINRLKESAYHTERICPEYLLTEGQ
jgi:hypothetical protein